jgi:hypothetical protein
MAYHPPSSKTFKKLYDNCKVKIKIGKNYTKVDYTTAAQQGDNMSPVLFLFVIQAFLDTLQRDAQPVQFSYFPENKNGNLATCKGRLLGQNNTAKGTTFDFRSSFYVDDSFFHFLKQIRTLPRSNKTQQTLCAFWPDHAHWFPHY